MDTYLHHLDFGYVVTSHSSQGQAADRVLVNRRSANVAMSRGRCDAQIYTNNKTQLAEGLGRDASHRTATKVRSESNSPTKREAPELERERELTRTRSYSIGR